MSLFASFSYFCLSVSFQIETHVDGERVRYFQDDDNVGLKEMVRREKMSSAQDQNALYSRMAAKVRRHFTIIVQYLYLTSEMLIYLQYKSYNLFSNDNKHKIFFLVFRFEHKPTNTKKS